jgi:hypothetical protein
MVARGGLVGCTGICGIPYIYGAIAAWFKTKSIARGAKAMAASATKKKECGLRSKKKARPELPGGALESIINHLLKNILRYLKVECNISVFQTSVH